MNAAQRAETCRDIAGICARGYDMHVQDHGPDGTAAVRTEDGSRYEVAETMIGGAMAFIDRGGERFGGQRDPTRRRGRERPRLGLRTEGGLSGA